MSETKLNGNVFDITSNKPLKGIVVNLFEANIAAATPIMTAVSGEEGQFVFDISDELSFPNGAYRLHANQNEEYEGELILQLERISIPENIPLGLNKYVISRKAGIIFTVIAMLFLVGMLVSAFFLHKIYPKNNLSFYTELVDLAHKQIELDKQLFDKSPVSDSLPNSPFKITEDMTVYHIMNTVDSSVQQSSFDFNSTQKQLISKIVQLSLMSKSVQEFRNNVDTLHSIFEKIECSFKIWSKNPWKFIEVFIWALIATIIRIVIFNGFHIYKNTYRKWAFIQHITLMMCIPIIAVIMTLIFNLMNFEVKFGDSALEIDLGNVYISITVATLIGFSPWKSWQYLMNLSEYFLNMLPGIASSNSKVEQN